MNADGSRATPGPAGLPGWVGDPLLGDLWRRVSDRLERNGLQVVGRVAVPTPTPPVQRAVGDLLGRRVTSSSCRIDLAVLDERLRLRAGLDGVIHAAERVAGRCLADRPRAREQVRFQRETPFRRARERLGQSSLGSQGWVVRWLDAVRHDGLLVRYRDPTGALLGSVAVLERVLADDSVWARTDLAASVLHDSHGLDDGAPVARLVLRALAQQAGTVVPAQASGRVALWESAGVVADSVSSTCLTLGLPWIGDGWRHRAWQQAAAEGDPVHLTAWDLERAELRLPNGLDVLVCENPRVLEAHAQRRGGTRPVVCTSGRPNLVVQRILRACAQHGAALRYHGDFDWPGIAIAHQVMDLCGAVPWRMTADDYQQADGFVPLEGPEHDPRWDGELGAAMRRRGVAVHEEGVLASLLR